MSQYGLTKLLILLCAFKHVYRAHTLLSGRLECKYTGVLILKEVLTDTELTIAVSGVGSADEKYIPSHSS